MGGVVDPGRRAAGRLLLGGRGGRGDPGAPAGGAHIADDLSFLNLAAVSNTGGKIVQVRIAGHKTGIVLEIDGFSVRAVPAGLGDRAITDGPHRGAADRRKVDLDILQ